MSITSRLDRVTHNLSPLQRAVLLLQALREGREPDPELRRFEDEVQRRAFNRYMALLWVANHELGAVVNVISARVEVVEFHAYQYALMNDAAHLLDEAEGAKPSKPQKGWREMKGEIEVSVFLRSVALDGREDGGALLNHLWQELQCLRSVWADLADEFAGEDVILPEHRRTATNAEERLRAAAVKLGVKKLPASPGSEFTDVLHALVDDAFKHLGLMEVYA